MRIGYWLVRHRVGPRGLYGPLCPAAIMWVHTTAEPGRPDNEMDRSPFLAAFIGGEVVSFATLFPTTDDLGERIVRIEQEIDEKEYQFRLADAAWAKKHAPHEPAANPRKRINLLQAPLPF